MAFAAGQKVRASDLNALNDGLVEDLYRTANSASGIAATDTVLDFVTAVLTAGRTYRLEWSGDMVGAGAVATYSFRVRYIAAASLTVAGSTIVRRKTWEIKAAGGHEPQFVTGRFTAPTTDTYSVGVSVIRLLGSGTVQSIAAADNETSTELFDVTRL
ncbi:hypothetical protein SD37_11785 [Amycolatopsis orientalis]|uniref:Uncharacterized protein n=1 Tax=Amycolatopsis orientalis TaxID=31958 RepID=A0A193BVR3_AMYOR|nr:hypothetical protein [Amycolatopsis orientalis]ANN16259.1 hypothetical protein SD37_11785 [Amycolatopsis orientalis]